MKEVVTQMDYFLVQRNFRFNIFVKNGWRIEKLNHNVPNVSNVHNDEQIIAQGHPMQSDSNLLLKNRMGLSYKVGELQICNRCEK